MAPFHFFRLSGPIIAGIFPRRMPDPDPKPCPFLPSKTIHCKINPIFTSYSVAKIQSDFKTLSSRKLSSSSLFPPPWMHHFAMGYAFTEVAAQTSAILAFFLKQVVVKREKEGEVGPEEGELKIEVHPWQALLKTWEATQARGNWGGELEAQKRIEKRLEKFEMLSSKLNRTQTQKLDKIEDLLAYV